MRIDELMKTCCEAQLDGTGRISMARVPESLAEVTARSLENRCRETRQHVSELTESRRGEINFWDVFVHCSGRPRGGMH